MANPHFHNVLTQPVKTLSFNACIKVIPATGKVDAMQPGDHLISARTGYSCHALYLGNGFVMHFATHCCAEQHALQVLDLEVFCQRQGYTVQFYPYRLYSHEESTQRALTMQLAAELHAGVRCEHFVRWCILGCTQQ